MSLTSPVVADYVFTMIRASKFYGPERKVLDNITLAFLPGAKIGVLGPNGAGKSTLLRIMAGVESPRAAAPSLRPERPSAGPAGARPRSGQGRPRQRRGRRPAAARLARSLQLDLRCLRRDRRGLRCLRRAGEGAGADRPSRRLVPRRPAGPRDGRAAAPRRRPRRHDPLGRRAAAGRALQAAPLPHRTCCSWTSRQTTWTRSSSPGSSGSSPTTPCTVVAVTHDRYFLDNVAGWILELDRGRGIPYEGNYTGWLEQTQVRLAHEEKAQSARRRALARSSSGFARRRRPGTRSRRRGSAPTSGCSRRSRT